MRLKDISRLKVVPGDEICVVEEFLPGDGAYEDNGRVKATVTGYPSINLDLRVVEVKPLSGKTRLPSPGNLIYGFVFSVRDEYALVRIYSDVKCFKYLTTLTGILHASQASDKYVKSVYSAVKPGDVIKAKVLSEAPPYHLTIKEHQLGVVTAYCSVCGAKLIKQGNTLACPSCGSTEGRKTSLEYGILKCP
ncbi:MAG: exosome complex RNA-binding protein Csl4 [Zestosphaera sp.]